MLPAEFTLIERGWFSANSIVIHGRSGPIIVDTGHLFERDKTVRLLRAHGVEPTAIQQIVTTHAHSDHHGGNRRLQEMSGAPIAMGWLTAEWFARGEQRLTWFDQVAQEVDVVPADIVYRPGDVIDLGGMPFEVLHLPGHAPDGIGLYQPDHKVMICADAMWENDVGVLNTPVHPQALEEAHVSIDRLRGYDIRWAIPGHGGMITDVAANLDRVARKLARFESEPRFLVQHYLRRMAMYMILRYQPIERDALLVMAAEPGHLSHYVAHYAAVLPHQDVRQWFVTILDYFFDRGLVTEDDEGMLHSRIRL